MGETTGIAWTDHTFNPWWGCTKVSPGCDRCYAETFDRRIGGAHWGKDAARRVFGEKHWREPLKWNAAAEKAGKRARVFCASMADVFDADAPAGELERLWALIRATPHLDWQLLTKRPARIARALPADWGDGYPNVWLGDDRRGPGARRPADPVLRAVPARVRFLSCEPLLGAGGLAAVHVARVRTVAGGLLVAGRSARRRRQGHDASAVARVGACAVH
jgi:protein gp37